MYKSILLLLVCMTIGHTYVHGQSKFNNILVAVQPTFGGRIMIYNNKNQKFKDSFSKTDQIRQSVSGTISTLIELNNSSQLQIGIQFQNLGFTRKVENIRFLDTIHPLIGIRADQVDAGPSWVEFRYRYHYFSLPFLYSKTLKRKKSNKAGSFHFVAGGAISGLINHDIKAKFFGFSFKKDKSLKIKENDNQAGLISANLQFGLRYENKIEEQMSIFVQPNLFLPILTANYGINKHLLYAFGFEIGIKHEFDFKK